MNAAAVRGVLYLRFVSVEISGDSADVAYYYTFSADGAGVESFLDEVVCVSCAGRRDVAAVVLRRIDDAFAGQIADDAADVVCARDVVLGVLCVGDGRVLRAPDDAADVARDVVLVITISTCRYVAVVLDVINRYFAVWLGGRCTIGASDDAASVGDVDSFTVKAAIHFMIFIFCVIVIMRYITLCSNVAVICRVLDCVAAAQRADDAADVIAAGDVELVDNLVFAVSDGSFVCLAYDAAYLIAAVVVLTADAAKIGCGSADIYAAGIA